ncbi:MAG: SCO family protein, partial [Thiomonas sp.]
MPGRFSATRRRFVFAVSSSALLLAACSKPYVFHGVDITGVPYASGFDLTDFNGKPRTLSDFAGKVVVMYFGYTQCPD